MNQLFCKWLKAPLAIFRPGRIEMDPVELESRRPELRERISQERIDALLSAIVSERRRKEGVTYLDDRLAALGVIDAPAGG